LAISDEQMSDYRRGYGQIVARAWSDDDYKARFLADAATVMREVGIELPGGVEVRAVENTPHLLHLVLPPRNASEEDLARVAGGLTMGTAGTARAAAGDRRGDEYATQYSEIIARARADDEFKRRLLVDPAAVMRECELEIPDGVEVRALESTDSLVYIALPPPPGEDVSEEDLALVAGGGDTLGSAGTFSSFACVTVPSSASCVFTAGTFGDPRP
jgi:hypothetical protein